jgi:hypothetical protein
MIDLTLPTRLGSLLLLTASLAACGGGGSSAPAAAPAGGGGAGGAGAPAATGTIGVTLGDAPSDAFDQILLTVTRIALLPEDDDEDAEAVVISEETETIDLLALDATTEFLGESDAVPAGEYCKIRLDVERIELTVLAEDGTVLESRDAELTERGFIDLNPRGCFDLAENGTLIVQIDLDARGSIVETGTGALKLRPVAFVDVIDPDDDDDTDVGERPERLTFLLGDVVRLAAPEGDDAFDLCSVRPVTTRGDGDPEDCERVVVSADTSIFDVDATPIELGGVDDGAPAIVAGRFEAAEDDGFVFDALLIDVGGRETFEIQKGVVLMDVMDGVFPLGDEDDLDGIGEDADDDMEDPDAGDAAEGDAADESDDEAGAEGEENGASGDDEAGDGSSDEDPGLPITIADGALIFTRGGEVVDASALVAGTEVRVGGLGEFDDVDRLVGIVATAIAIREDDDDDDEDSDEGPEREVEGVIASLGPGNQVQVSPDDDDSRAEVCIVVNPATDIVIVMDDDESMPGTREDVVVGAEIEAFGPGRGNGCLAAKTLIIEIDDDEDDSDEGDSAEGDSSSESGDGADT